MKHLKGLCMLLLILGLVLSTASMGFAESNTEEGNLQYEGDNEFTGDFYSSKVASSLSEMEPGDDITYIINYTNASGKVTRWYMKNEVLKTLEAGGTRAQNGGYTYILTNEVNGKVETLFDNSVGGLNEDGNVDLKGLEQATNALKDYFFIGELDDGDYGQVVLHVYFDGETEVNSYMDTNGKLMFNFAVEEKESKTVHEPGEDEHITKTIIKHVPGEDKIIKETVIKRVKTGDTTVILPIVAVFVAAVILLFVAIFGWRKQRKGGEKA